MSEVTKSMEAGHSKIEDLYSASIQAKWHSFHFEVLRNDRGLWLQLVETRPRGHRQTIVIEPESMEEFDRELLKAVSAVRGAIGADEGLAATPEPAHSASAVRPRSYTEWSEGEDRVLRFLAAIGSSVGEIASALQRDRGAVRSRMMRLDKTGVAE